MFAREGRGYAAANLGTWLDEECGVGVRCRPFFLLVHVGELHCVDGVRRGVSMASPGCWGDDWYSVCRRRWKAVFECGRGQSQAAVAWGVEGWGCRSRSAGGAREWETIGGKRGCLGGFARGWPGHSPRPSKVLAGSGCLECVEEMVVALGVPV